MFEEYYQHPLRSGLFVFSYVIGIMAAAFAILRSRTPQGATAWVMSLLSFPFIAVPLFLFFGHDRFRGYNSRRRLLDSKVIKDFDALNALDQSVFSESNEMKIINGTIFGKSQPGFTCGNNIELLQNGEMTYASMMNALELAEKYILFQFYIFRCDEAGLKFAHLLMKKSREGVKVYFLNDDIGGKLPRSLKKEMHAAGIELGTFNKRHGRGRLQVNFRNHRKVIVVDGKEAFIGGHNIGNDYLGLYPQCGFWRDTHVKIQGPSVIATQLAFAKDWYGSQHKILDIPWKITTHKNDANVLVLHTGPADYRQTALLSHLSLINSSTKRLWIANPYLVPPESLQDAIILAALRGVDVRILVPKYSDSRTIMLASEVYIKRFLENGIRIYRYNKGFLHQKVMLIDDLFGSVGSMNFDNRSMFINFEINAISTDSKFISDMDQMLNDDFKGAEELNHEFDHLSLFQKIAARGANLFAPVL